MLKLNKNIENEFAIAQTQLIEMQEQINFLSREMGDIFREMIKMANITEDMSSADYTSFIDTLTGQSDEVHFVEMPELTDIPDYDVTDQNNLQAEIFTLEDFELLHESGTLCELDGFAYYATETQEDLGSNYFRQDVPEWSTHISWYALPSQ